MQQRTKLIKQMEGAANSGHSRPGSCLHDQPLFAYGNVRA
jgi:hypothetical protein